MADERLGFVGIVVEDRASVPAVNEILSSFSPIIRGRMGAVSYTHLDVYKRQRWRSTLATTLPAASP